MCRKANLLTPVCDLGNCSVYYCKAKQGVWVANAQKEIIPKGNQSWIFIGRTDAEAENQILWPPGVKIPWSWERLKAGEEGDDRGWDDWMTSPIRWTWVWASSRSWWWIGKPGVLQSMGSLQVGHDWATPFSLFTFMHCRRKWQPTPVFLPGESQGRGAWWAAVYGVAQS